MEELNDLYEIVQDKELERLQTTNLDRFRKHLQEHGDISEFQYN